VRPTQLKRAPSCLNSLVAVKEMKSAIVDRIERIGRRLGENRWRD
jgi:hypothetical protein